jgi:hypothetical protein
VDIVEERTMQFTGITREKFTAIENKLKEEAEVDVPGDSGMINNHGFSIIWSYVEAYQTLTINIDKKPWFIPDSTVEAQMSKLVQEA